MPIHQKILDIQKRVGPVGLNGVGPDTMGKFPFMKISDIIAAVKPLLNENSIIVQTTVTDESHEIHLAETKVAMDGSPRPDGRVANMRAVQHYMVEFAFIDTEDGTQFVVTVPGEAIDIQDKATRKAITSAWKIALMQTFIIHDGDEDPDATAPNADAAEVAEPKLNHGQQKIAAASPAKAKAKSAVKEQPKEEPVERTENVSDPATLVQPTGPNTESGTEWKPDPADVAAAQQITEEAKRTAPSNVEIPAAEEDSAGPVQDTPDELKKAKAEFRAAVAAAGGLTTEKIDQLARDGISMERAQWIKSARNVRRVIKLLKTGEV